MKATKRRICWPNPDATCLEYGCIHCDNAPLRALKTIERYALAAGQVPNRCGGGSKDAHQAYLYGLHRIRE